MSVRRQQAASAPESRSAFEEVIRRLQRLVEEGLAFGQRSEFTPEENKALDHWWGDDGPLRSPASREAQRASMHGFATAADIRHADNKPAVDVAGAPCPARTQSTLMPRLINIAHATVFGANESQLSLLADGCQWPDVDRGRTAIRRSPEPSSLRLNGA